MAFPGPSIRAYFLLLQVYHGADTFGAGNARFGMGYLQSPNNGEKGQQSSSRPSHFAGEWLIAISQLKWGPSNWLAVARKSPLDATGVLVLEVRSCVDLGRGVAAYHVTGSRNGRKSLARSTRCVILSLPTCYYLTLYLRLKLQMKPSLSSTPPKLYARSWRKTKLPPPTDHPCTLLQQLQKT